MRVFAAVFLGISLAASPLLARNAGETGKEDTPVAVSSSSSLPDKPAAVKPEASAIESEMQDLRSLVEEQRAELESQRAALKAQQLKMEALEEKFGATPSESIAAPAAITTAVSSATPISSATAALGNPSASPAQKGDDEVSPLQLRIGSAYITPVGFMDFTGVWRSHTGGSGIGTNFASIPYNTGGTNFNDHLGELRESMQNSRIGFRVDALVAGAHVIGYMESDFLGNNPGNVAVSSNSNTLRSRLYWVDVQRDKWEVLGGQTWSLITPGRSGISPLPGNLFFTQNIDVNYQLGLVWGRIPELRFVAHPSSKVAFAVALDSPEQYVGGSAGGSTIVFPTLPASLTSGSLGNQLDAGGTTLNTPNLAPDFIEKLAFDPVSKFHFELGGLERVFKIYNSGTNTSSTKTGAGGFVNLNFELFKGFRILTNNFWSSGGGRYIFGQAPDLIVRADGTISPIKAGSTVSGFEFTHGKTMLYGYFGGLYVWKNLALDGSTPAKVIGYGVTGQTGQNRFIGEETIGFNQTIWRDAKYGALNFMGQYSYLARNPWSFTTGGEDAHLNMIFLNLRYTLPGSAPTLGK
ncbi:MAG TPA: hypothetical protein VN976_02915 [Verrucomicrobiae bacterium]|nr:hypothetical protein [Verrucomicrobiae bacterium]